MNVLKKTICNVFEQIIEILLGSTDCFVDEVIKNILEVVILKQLLITTFVNPGTQNCILNFSKTEWKNKH